MPHPWKTLNFAPVVSLFALVTPALAGVAYDGTWIVDVPPAGYIENAGGYECPALRFPIDIKDGIVAGRLKQVPSDDGGLVVEAGSGRVSAPVTGKVQPDGWVTAEWLNYHAEGNLEAANGVVTIKGECGPVQATLIRVQ